MTKIAVEVFSSEQFKTVVRFAQKSDEAYDAFRMPSWCVNLNGGSHCSVEYYKENGYKVIPFSEFEKQYLNKKKSNSSKKNLSFLVKKQP